MEDWNMAKIMTAGDNPDVIRLVKLILRYAGHDVITAASVSEALSKLKKTQPDLLLLDFMMADLEGLETHDLIKNQENLKEVPVAMLTAKTLSEFLDKENIEMAVDHVQKPFTENSLVGKVNVIFENLTKIPKKSPS